MLLTSKTTGDPIPANVRREMKRKKKEVGYRKNGLNGPRAMARRRGEIGQNAIWNRAA